MFLDGSTGPEAPPRLPPIRPARKGRCRFQRGPVHRFRVRRRWLPGVTAVAAILTGLVALPAPAAADLHVGPVYLEDFPTVRLVVEPPDPSGPGVLAPEDLVLLEDGVATGPAREIVPFGETGRGTAVLVALDVSGTMAGAPLEQTRSALLRLVRESGPADRIALVTFADDVRVESPFGAPREDLAAAIRGLSPRGRITELYRALFKAFDLLEAPDLPARRRLLVISDGKDEGEAYGLDDVVERARSRRIPVDAIGLTRIDARYLSNLDRLATLTGGTWAPAANASELEELVQQGRERLAATPLATFQARRLTADGQPHELGVRLTRDGRLWEGTVPALLPAAPPPEGEPAGEGTGEGAADAGDGAGEGTGEGAGADGEVGPEGATDAGAWPSWLPYLLVALLGVLLLGAAVGVLRRRGHRSAGSRSSPGPPSRAPAPPVGRLLDTGEPTVPEGRPPGPASAEEVPPRSLEVAPPHGPQDGPGAGPHVDPGADPDAGVVSEPVPRQRTRFSPIFPTPGPGAPAILLVGEEGPASGRRVPVESDPFWIGASEDADLPIPEDEYLSSFHAAIQFHEGSLLLHDPGSTNGTFLNGSRLGPEQQKLSPGDRLRVGHSVFVLQRPAP